MAWQAQNDKKLIVHAAANAQKACDFILDRNDAEFHATFRL